MVSVLDFSDCKTGLFPEKYVLSVQSACAVLSSATCLTVLSLSTLSHEREDFRKKKKILNLKCVFRFSLQCMSAIFLNIRRTYRNVITNVHRSTCKVPVILVRF